MNLPLALGLFALLLACAPAQAQPLPGTEPLTQQGDLSAQMVAGIDRFLMRETEASVARRARHWKRDFSSPEAYAKSVEPNRQRLRKIIGAVDPRVPAAMEYVSGPGRPAGKNLRWPVSSRLFPCHPPFRSTNSTSTNPTSWPTLTYSTLSCDVTSTTCFSSPPTRQ